MRRSTRMLLLCLVVYILLGSWVFAFPNDSIRVIIRPESTYQPLADTPDSAQPMPQPDSDGAFFRPASWSAQAPMPSFGSMRALKPIAKCKAPVCLPNAICAPPPRPPCVLPRRGCGQFELAAQAFFARVDGRINFPDVWFGISHPDVDFNDGLGFDDWKVLMDYSAWYQFRPNWAFYYAIMPIHIEGTSTPAGTLISSKWDFVYQRLGLLYTPINSCRGRISVFGGWVYNDSRLRTNTGNHCTLNSCTVLDRTRQMAQAGIELQKCIRTLCNGGTASCDNRVGISFLDGTLVLDVQASLRFSVPMNCGRWGYARGGYRYLSFREDRDDLAVDKVTLDGGFVELGLIF